MNSCDDKKEIHREIKKEIREIHEMKKAFHYRSFKTRHSRLDKYREEIEYIRYELKAPINEIHLWLRKKHHLKISIRAIDYRLQKWKKEE